MLPRVRYFIGLVVCMALAAAAGRVEAALPTARVEAVYAAFAINLTRFVTWPPESLGAPGKPFLLGTFVRDPINPDLDAAVRGESVGTHPLRTVRLRTSEDARECQLVFVSHGVANVRTLLALVGHRPILTVSDSPEFLALGGAVRFVPQSPHTQLQISAEALRAAGLQARAQLLRFAATP